MSALRVFFCRINLLRIKTKQRDFLLKYFYFVTLKHDAHSALRSSLAIWIYLTVPWLFLRYQLDRISKTAAVAPNDFNNF